MDLREWTTRKREALRALGPLEVRDVTPSIRDFTHAVTTRRSALAVVAELARATPEEGALADEPDWLALVRACEGSSVSAVAVATDAVLCRGSAADLRAISTVSTNPVAQRDLILAREQLYQARLAGADAVLLTAAAVSAGELEAFVEIASSMHMAAPVEVRSPVELLAAAAAGARVVVIPAFESGRLALSLPDELLPRVPRQLAPLVRGPFAHPEDFAPLRGRADGVWVCGPLMKSGDPRAFLAPLVSAGEG